MSRSGTLGYSTDGPLADGRVVAVSLRCRPRAKAVPQYRQRYTRSIPSRRECLSCAIRTRPAVVPSPAQRDDRNSVALRCFALRRCVDLLICSAVPGSSWSRGRHTGPALCGTARSQAEPPESSKQAPARRPDAAPDAAPACSRRRTRLPADDAVGVHAHNPSVEAAPRGNDTATPSRHTTPDGTGPRQAPCAERPAGPTVARAAVSRCMQAGTVYARREPGPGVDVGG